VQGISNHTEPRSQDDLTCKVIQDAIETQDKTRHIEEGHDKGGQKLTKWRGGCREESPRSGGDAGVVVVFRGQSEIQFRKVDVTGRNAGV
jgi:hypothetical protein